MNFFNIFLDKYLSTHEITGDDNFNEKFFYELLNNDRLINSYKNKMYSSMNFVNHAHIMK